ncbi:hypothetical protein CMI47_18955 [Candidatus Pacearchaeota archaeon]|nr:hypothetical protein [Candidatus Pacearchaeota archaeon]|tara:strand:- start:14460 stop:14810 length:351 start_codon:yes stop_codon:yes gene_type:complete
MRNTSSWVPEILYEENSDGSSSNIPFVMVPDGEDMPSLLYIFESRDTGEFEPGLDGEDVPVSQWDLHQYADLLVLKSKLSIDDYNKVRIALGLQTLEEAVEAGRKITSNVKNNLET